MKGWIVAAAVMLLAACAKEVPPPAPTLIVESKVVFLERDGKTPRAAPKEKLRIWMPTLVGDMYGSPNEGEIVPVDLRPDLTFTLDLNGAGPVLEKGLVPSAFSQKWMAIQPAEARIARMLPFVMPADNIGPVGVAEWLDPASGAKLMLLYLDRPSRVIGEIVYEGRQLKFDIEAKQAGYLWVRQPEGNGTFRSVPRPEQVQLAVFPPA